MFSLTLTRNGKFRFTKKTTIHCGALDYIIPKGFVTDGASIPWFAQWLGTPYEGDSIYGAVVHDILYQARGRFKIGRKEYKIPRANVDHIFYLLMRQHHVNIIKAILYFTAVRLVGWLPWYFGKKPKHDIMVSIKTLIV
jgi:hypothetical protein